MAHELAHYYWNGNADWINEGTAEFVAAVVAGPMIGRPLMPDNDPCALTTTIAGLEGTDVPGDRTCNYSLGERLFIDLRDELGEDGFRRAFRSLYLDNIDEERGISHVRAAFGEGTTSVKRWYEGTEPYASHRRDNRPVEAELPHFNGRVKSASIVMGEERVEVTEVPGDADEKVRIQLKFSYKVPEERSIEIRVVEYFEDGFPYDAWTDTITAEPGYIGDTIRWTTGSPPRAKGEYTVYVYADDLKVAEATLSDPVDDVEPPHRSHLAREINSHTLRLKIVVENCFMLFQSDLYLL